MSQGLPSPERRSGRRMPMGSAARILPARGAPVEAQCVELSVGGMTLRADYVPGEAEIFTVELLSPPGGLERPPLLAQVEVRRCHGVGEGRYEIGVAILRVLA